MQRAARDLSCFGGAYPERLKQRDRGTRLEIGGAESSLFDQPRTFSTLLGSLLWHAATGSMQAT
jgi:hypothetical protein